MRTAMLRTALLWMAMGALARASSGLANGAQAGGEKVAMVVGVQRYSETKGFAPLRYAERDAQSFYDLLVDPQRGGYEPARVKLFTTASRDPQQLPVRGNLLAALNHLEDWASTPGGGKLDTVLIYFSGHGVAEGPKSYLIPVDASRDDLASTAISLDEVQARLAKCGAKKQIVILDACRFQASPGKAPGDEQNVSFARKLEELGRAEGRVVLASCSQNEASYEDQASEHSAFTAFLLQGLQGPADADADGVISVTESHEYVSRQMVSWSRQQELKQTPRLYGEITLTLPLVRCPLWAELRITSVPSEAEVWVDGESTNQRTPYTSRIKLVQGRSRVVKVRLTKPGYQDLEKEVAVAAGAVSDLGLALREQPRLAAHIAPSVRPALPDWTATTFYGEAGHITGLAPRPDGSVLVTVAVPQAVRQGVYVAYPGDECDAGDAYCPPGEPLKRPESVWMHPDGRVFVTEGPTSTIWVIPSAGSSPQVFTQSIVEPHDLLVAPAGFEGPGLHAGDYLVCAGGAGDPDQAGLWVLDQKTLAPRRLVGPPALANGLRHAAFGPDGKLYAMEDDATRDGVTIVTIAPDGQIARYLGNYLISPHAPQTGPLAISAADGTVYFAFGSSVYRVRRDGGKVELFARTSGEASSLATWANGGAVLVGDARSGQVVDIRPSPPGTPTLQVEIRRGYYRVHSASMLLAPWYKHRVQVTASDDDGVDDIASVTIIDPEGSVQRLTPEGGPYRPAGAAITSGDWSFGVPWGNAHWRRRDEHSIECHWARCAMYLPPKRGQYSITVTDRSGNSTALTTPEMPPPEDIGLELLSPASGTAIQATTPVFVWRSRWSECSWSLEVHGGELAGSLWTWSGPSGPQTGVAYNADGKAELPALTPGHLYGCGVRATRPAEIPSADARLKVYACAQVYAEFAIYQEWPERPPRLPGKLVYQIARNPGYGNTAESRMMLYSPDPRVRITLGPNDISHWSPDGTSLLYACWVDALGGDPPVLIPSWGGEIGRWAPDGKRIASDMQGPWSPFISPNYDIWVARADGSGAYPLVRSIRCSERSPAWSPDGLWIAYDRESGEKPAPARPGRRTWLVRYDGLDDHPLGVTGVVGHEGYRVTRVTSAAWSPSENRLAVTFAAQPANSGYAEGDVADPAMISGVGTVSSSGGAIRPVFLGPPAAVCCAGPRDPAWSPDGTKIVFPSAHQLASFAAPGEPEPGVELWLVNADGSGKPIRLTYDHLVTHHATWWAPNTEPGPNVKVVKGDASVTFESVTESGSTGLVAYVDAPQSLPEGFEFAGLRYELWTTAKVSGTITLEIHYHERSLPAGQEGRLRLLYQEGDHSMDVTVLPVDTANGVLRGRCTTPGAFTLAVAR